MRLGSQRRKKNILIHCKLPSSIPLERLKHEKESLRHGFTQELYRSQKISLQKNNKSGKFECSKLCMVRLQYRFVIQIVRFWPIWINKRRFDCFVLFGKNNLKQMIILIDLFFDIFQFWIFPLFFWKFVKFSFYSLSEWEKEREREREYFQREILDLLHNLKKIISTLI